MSAAMNVESCMIKRRNLWVCAYVAKKVEQLVETDGFRVDDAVAFGNKTNVGKDIETDKGSAEGDNVRYKVGMPVGDKLGSDVGEAIYTV